MSINIEKEARAMLNKDTHAQMVSLLCTNVTPIKQTNYYFDTIDHILLKNHIVLRIRNINDLEYELTIKIKGNDGDKEINKSISKNEYQNYINNKLISNLKIEGIEGIKDYLFIVDLSTIRYEIPLENALLVIDENFYNGQHDYNIEIESKISLNHANELLEKYAKKYGFTISNNYLSKSRRVFNSLI